MKNLFPIAALFILFFINGVFAQTARDAAVISNLEIGGILIEPQARFIGERAFRAKMQKAIDLLKNKAPDEFRMMQKYIGRIRAAQVSSANYNEEVMTIDIAPRTFDSSLEWLASVLIHETHHIKKYKDTGKKYGDAHLMTDKKAALQVMIDEELECNKIQLVVLEKVGGAKFEIDHLKAQKGDHFDIDKDGDYDWDDYAARDWD